MVDYPSVVRGFAPPTDGYDALDLWRGPFPQGGGNQGYHHVSIQVTTRLALTGTGAVTFDGNGRTDRASLQGLLVRFA